ncbi:hypothetical protein AcV5_002499 [Taiwanofungus camphoratus]|nr:hypothetical protein AcV5_002499 [Antrodia cinnamomea]
MGRRLEVGRARSQMGSVSGGLEMVRGLDVHTAPGKPRRTHCSGSQGFRQEGAESPDTDGMEESAAALYDGGACDLTPLHAECARQENRAHSARLLFAPAGAGYEYIRCVDDSSLTQERGNEGPVYQARRHDIDPRAFPGNLGHESRHRVRSMVIVPPPSSQVALDPK